MTIIPVTLDVRTVRCDSGYLVIGDPQHMENGKLSEGHDQVNSEAVFSALCSPADAVAAVDEETSAVEEGVFDFPLVALGPYDGDIGLGLIFEAPVGEHKVITQFTDDNLLSITVRLDGLEDPLPLSDRASVIFGELNVDDSTDWSGGVELEFGLDVVSKIAIHDPVRSKGDQVDLGDKDTFPVLPVVIHVNDDGGLIGVTVIIDDREEMKE